MLSRYKILILFIILTIVSICVRIVGIRDAGVVSDEELWLSRSSRVVTRLETSPTKATSHLVHPGLTPSLVMASGQIVASHWNSRLKQSPGDSYFITPLTGSRIAIAAVSSLIAPIAFLGLVLGIELFPAFTASLFVALDPGLIGMARMAHLDSMMALLVMLTLTLYHYSILYRSTPIKISAGVIWGFAVLTKVTAVILVPVFILYRVVLALWIRPSTEYGDAEEGWLSWSDVWAIIAGHLVIILTYTRLWFHPSEFLLDYGVTSRAADLAFRWGQSLHRHPYLVGSFLVPFLIAVSYWHRTRKSAWSNHVTHFSFLGSLIILVATIRPTVVENLIRFWKWTRALSHKKDVVFGSTAVFEPPAHGYLDLMLKSVPELLLIGVAFGSIIFFFQFYRRENRERLSLLTLCFIATVLWLGILSISPKESWRYASPVVPLLAAFSAVGLFGMMNWGAQFLCSMPAKNRYSVTPSIPSHFPFAAQGVTFSLLLIFSCWNSLRWYPHYFLYRNWMYGGVHHVENRQPNFSTREVIEFLIEERKRLGVAQLKVSVFGNAFVHIAMAKGRFFKKTHDKITFANYRPRESHLRLEYRPGHRLHEYREWDTILSSPPIYSYSFHGAPLIGIYKVSREKLQES